MKELNWWLKWTACFITLGGALSTSLSLDPLNIILFNLGSLIYVVWAWRIREASLITINAGLLTIYAVGAVLRIV
jgi:hypothetical protein